MTQPDILARPGDQARDNLSARNAMLDWMQQIAPYGIFTTDADLRIRSWNHWLTMHSGMGPETVVGRLLTEVFPDVKARRLDEHFRHALSGEVSVLSTALHKYLLPLPTTARESVLPHMLQTVRIAPLPAGDVMLGTITIIEDVSQRESHALRLQRQQEHDRMLSEALGVLLRSSNPLMDVAALFPKIAPTLGVEAYANYLFHAETQTLRLNSSTGMPPKKKEAMSVLLLGEGLSGLCAERREPIYLNHVQQSTDPHAHVAKAADVRSYCCFPLQIGDRLVGTLSFASYSRDTIAADDLEFLSTIASYVAIAIDRALRENALELAQRSLSEHANILESKVAERTARLHETIAQLESFSYTVAHDLRAPIRSLRGYCDILLSDYALPESGHAILERLQRASNRLDALTRDLLRFSKIARQDVQLETVDVQEIVTDLLLLMPNLGDDIVVVHPPLEKVRAQRTLLQQCLSNLFDNAVKFVPNGTRPKIIVRTELRQHTTSPTGAIMAAAFNPPIRAASVTGAEGRPRQLAGDASDAPRVRIWVEDNGIGIAPEAHDKIFGIFERVSGLEHIEGTGIGLAIVARAVQQMGGACGVESAPGKGSRFWLEFAPADAAGKG